MYGLMLALFICSCIYYLLASIDILIIALQVVFDNPNIANKQWSWGHLFLILLNIFVTVVSAMYCFGGVR